MAVTLINLCQDKDGHQLLHLVNFKVSYVYEHQWKVKMMILVSQEGIHGEDGVLATV